jgi:hypothetical protein
MQEEIKYRYEDAQGNTGMAHNTTTPINKT